MSASTEVCANPFATASTISTHNALIDRGRQMRQPGYQVSIVSDRLPEKRWAKVR